MPKPQERNQEETKVIFQSWLDKKLANASNISIEILGGPENTGFSNETLSFNVSYSHDGQDVSQGMVLRFYPEGFFVFPDYDIYKQFLIMQKLSTYNIKVPNVLWYESSTEVFGTSFYVMEMAKGEAPSDNPPFHQEGWVVDSSEDVRKKIIQGLKRHGYEEGKEYVVIKVPNIIDISYGRGVGYTFTEHNLGEEIHKISATNIRKEMRLKGNLKEK